MEIGQIGGRNGRGKSKTRSPEHYKRLTRIRAANAKKRKAAAAKEAKK
jgi:hypothetical protein